jgi:2-oxoisovalerate dehydrogenase E1 component
MRGHEEASGVKYVPPHLFDEWQKKDPIHNYEQYLTEIGLLTSSSIEEIKIKFKQNIEAELEIGFASAEVVPNTDDEIRDVYAPSHNALMEATGPKVNRKFFDAITDALDQSMERYDNLVLMGQDIAEYGGAFKITEGLLEKYGKARVRNTPLCESAIIGTALGLSLEGYKSMVEMQFADFVSVGLNQIVNNLAKIHYRWGQNADVVVRMPTGAGVGAGPFHSQSNEAWFIKTAGLKVVYPSNAYDAKGLLNASISDPNPVLFFEHKALYRSISGDVPSAYYELPIGKAAVISEGTDACIITYGMGVHWATALANDYKNRGYSIAIVDLRSLAPIDYETIKNVVNNTGKVLVLTEDNTIGSLASEVAAWIGENCFAQLDAPVMRCGSLETPIPFNTTLEKNFLANARLAAQLDKLLNY